MAPRHIFDLILIFALSSGWLRAEDSAGSPSSSSGSAELRRASDDAATQMQAGRYAEALMLYTAALSGGSDLEALLLERAACFSAIGQWELASRDLARAEAAALERNGGSVDSDFCPIYYEKGRALLRLNRSREAIELLERVLQLDPTYPRARDTLARVLATDPDPRLRDLERARDYALQACEQSNWQDPHSIDTFAAVLASSGDFEGAWHWQSEALKRFPDSGLSQVYKQRLQNYFKRRLVVEVPKARGGGVSERQENDVAEVVVAYCRACLYKDWEAAARLLHPDYLESFKAFLTGVVVRDFQGDPEALRDFVREMGMRTVEQIDLTDAATLFVRFMDMGMRHPQGIPGMSRVEFLRFEWMRVSSAGEFLVVGYQFKPIEGEAQPVDGWVLARHDGALRIVDMLNSRWAGGRAQTR